MAKIFINCNKEHNTASDGNSTWFAWGLGIVYDDHVIQGAYSIVCIGKAFVLSHSDGRTDVGTRHDLKEARTKTWRGFSISSWSTRKQPCVWSAKLELLVGAGDPALRTFRRFPRLRRYENHIQQESSLHDTCCAAWPRSDITACQTATQQCSHTGWRMMGEKIEQ
jgi:hypothetical protein